MPAEPEEIKLEPGLKHWTCWHEAARAVAVILVGGEIQSITFDRGVTWTVPNYAKARPICGAGSVIDRAERHVFPDSESKLARREHFHQQELAYALARENKELGLPPPTDEEVLTEFDRGVFEAEQLLGEANHAAAVLVLRDVLEEKFQKGTERVIHAEVRAPLRKLIRE